MPSKILISILLSLGIYTSVAAQKFKPQTSVSIQGEDFYINGQITLKGKTYQGSRLEGLLPNSRMVQGIFDDANPQTRHHWQFPDNKAWDPERNTNEFILAMSDWRAAGLLAITLNLQGGNPFGYGASQPWINTAFKPDGRLDKDYMARLEKILQRADQLGMVVILGYFYFGQDQHLKDEAAVIQGVRMATQWVLEKGYTHVILEINNECDINNIVKGNNVEPYNHAILDSKRVHELIGIAQSIQKNKRRLLVATSFIGGALPTDEVLKISDYFLIHGNGVHKPEKITEMVQTLRLNKNYKGQPIVFNEDDHFAFNQFCRGNQGTCFLGLFRLPDERRVL